MTIFLTICSANYLAQAKTLADSVHEHHPTACTVIGLVDRVPGTLPPGYYAPHELLPVEDLLIPDFALLSRKYNIVELNTAVKPFFIKYLYHRDVNVSKVIYLDPDILVLGSLNQLLDNLTKYMLVVTPHGVTSSDLPGGISTELDMLGTGIYNLGFLGTSRKPRIFEFLEWWGRRLESYCYYQPQNSLFVDQLWMILVPHFFGDVYVENDFGYNVSYWNAYERTLSKINNHYLINGQTPLIFYHFSSYSAIHPNVMTRRRCMTFAETPELRGLFDTYRNRLLKNGFNDINILHCAFGAESTRVLELQTPVLRVKRALQKFIRYSLSRLPVNLRNRLKRACRFIIDNS